MRKNYSHDVYTFTTLTLNHIKINDIYTYKKIPKEQKSEIKTMLLELGLDRNFEKNLFFKMRYDNYTFYNEVINALRISIELTSKSLNNAFLAPMQSGKTGTIKFLCNTILPNINFLNPDESVLFLTSMTDVDLRDQNIRTLENGDSNIIVLSMSKFKRSGIEIVKRNNVKLIVRDEDQYGCGYESSFDFSLSLNNFANGPLIAVSSILNQPKPLEPSSLISVSKSSICFRVSNSLVYKALIDPCEDKISFRKLIDVSVKTSVMSNIVSSILKSGLSVPYKLIASS